MKSTFTHSTVANRKTDSLQHVFFRALPKFKPLATSLLLMFLLTGNANKVNAQINNALAFETGDYVNCGTDASLNITGDITIEAWVYVDPSCSNLATIAGNKQAGGSVPGYSFYINTYSTSDRRLVFETDGANARTSSPVIINNVWTHVAVSVSSNVATFFVNGVSVPAASTAVNMTSSTYPTNLGCFGDGNFKYYAGRLDEVRIWSEARSAAEVTADMTNDLSGTETNLEAYYNFNQGIAGGNNTAITSLIDQTGTNDGTLTGFSLTGSTSNFVGSIVGSTTPAPTVTLFTPTNATTGQTVTITGTDLTGTSSVSFGGIAATSFTVINNTTVTAVVAVGASGDVSVTTSSGTATKSGFLFASAPDAPTAVSAQEGNTQATISFTTPASDGGSAITSYTVTSSPDGITATGTASPIIITGLTNETAYTFTVSATNAVGTGASSAASGAVTPSLSVFDNALSFDDDYVVVGNQLSNSLSGQTAITIETWVKVDQFNRWATIFCAREDHSNKIQFGFSGSGSYNQLLFQVGSNGSLSSAQTVNTLSLDTWYHVTAIFDGTQTTPSDRLKIYIDGVLQPVTTSGSFATATGTLDVPSYIGDEYAGSDYVNLNGTLDETRIWTSARTASEIQDNINTDLSGSETGLLAYYSYNQGVACRDNSGITTLTDDVSGTNNGTLSAFTLDGPLSNFVGSVGSQWISFSALTSRTYGDVPFTVSATGGASGNPVIFTSSDPTVANCTGTNGSTITIIKAGSCTIYANQAGNATTLAAPQIDQTLTINAKELTITGVTASNKEYNNSTAATLTGGTLSGVETGDVVTLTSGTGTFASSDVGTGIAITATGYAITGTHAANYSISQPTGLSADITAKALIMTGVTASNKIYDATTNATLTGGTLVGIEGGDVVTLNAGTGTFASADVGTAIAITASGYGLTGTDAGNYSVSQPTGLSADITAKALIMTGVTASNKIYDATTNATLTGGTLVGIEGGDVVTLNAGTGTFASADVGTAIAITASGYGLTGTDAGNYSVSQPTGLSADITAKALTITGVTASSKIYDATTNATLTGGTLVGVESGDVVTLNAGTGTFASADVGTAIAITASGYGLTGTDAGNYSVSQATGLSADITAKPLTITDVIAHNKVYDATTTAILTGGTLTGVEAGDDVSFSEGIGTFASPNMGTDIAITASGYSISGADAGNYTVSQPTGLSADITGKLLTISGVTASNKVYDGTTTALLTGGTLVGVEAGDDVTLTEGTGTFATINVGTGIAITAIGYELSGSNAGDYSLTAQPSGLIADITVKELTVSNTEVVTSKKYDGNTSAIVSSKGALNGVETVDENSLDFTVEANYNDALPGTDKTISVLYTLTGTSASNYVLLRYHDIENAVIEETVIPTASYSASAGCSGEEIDLAYTIQEGSPIEYRIVFSQAAKVEGFVDIDYTSLPSAANNDIISFPIPVNASYGSYEAQIQLRDEVGAENALETFSFSINLSSSFVLSKFNDVVFCDNSAEEFVSYQWYKDGVLIDGATGQFYNDINGLSGTYSVTIVTADGQTINSCNKYLSSSTVKSTAVSVYPNPVNISEDFVVQINNLENEELEGAEMKIYSSTGTLVYSTKQVEEQNNISLPLNGVYQGVLVTRNGKTLSYKVIVRK